MKIPNKTLLIHTRLEMTLKLFSVVDEKIDFDPVEIKDFVSCFNIFTQLSNVGDV